MLHNRFCTALSTLAVLLITACNADNASALDDRSGSGTLSSEAVTFGVSEVQAVSRAGFVGELDPLFIRATGIGVYAYVTSGTTWTAGGSTRTPNFMLNEHVTFESSQGWVYRPLKYWPNQAATPASIDRVSFFAYAPYVDLDKVPYNDAAAALTAAAADGFEYQGILSLPSI